jgi:predicted AlkP superfamily phosphohydrolase/phosphomutase
LVNINNNTKENLKKLSFILGKSKDEIVETLINNAYYTEKNETLKPVYVPYSMLINTTTIEKVFGKKMKMNIIKNVPPAFSVAQKKKYLKKDIITYLVKNFGYDEKKLYEILNIPESSNNNDILMKSELSEYMQISPYKVDILQKRGLINEMQGYYLRKEIDALIDKIINNEVNI